MSDKHMHGIHWFSKNHQDQYNDRLLRIDDYNVSPQLRGQNTPRPASDTKRTESMAMYSMIDGGRRAIENYIRSGAIGTCSTQTSQRLDDSLLSLAFPEPNNHDTDHVMLNKLNKRIDMLHQAALSTGVAAHDVILPEAQKQRNKLAQQIAGNGNNTPEENAEMLSRLLEASASSAMQEQKSRYNLSTVNRNQTNFIKASCAQRCNACSSAIHKVDFCATPAGPKTAYVVRQSFVMSKESMQYISDNAYRTDPPVSRVDIFKHRDASKETATSDEDHRNFLANQRLSKYRVIRFLQSIGHSGREVISKTALPRRQVSPETLASSKLIADACAAQPMDALTVITNCSSQLGSNKLAILNASEDPKAGAWGQYSLQNTSVAIMEIADGQVVVTLTYTVGHDLKTKEVAKLKSQLIAENRKMRNDIPQRISPDSKDSASKNDLLPIHTTPMRVHSRDHEIAYMQHLRNRREDARTLCPSSPAILQTLGLDDHTSLSEGLGTTNLAGLTQSRGISVITNELSEGFFNEQSDTTLHRKLLTHGTIPSPHRDYAQDYNTSNERLLHLLSTTQNTGLSTTNTATEHRNTKYDDTKSAKRTDNRHTSAKDQASDRRGRSPSPQPRSPSARRRWQSGVRSQSPTPSDRSSSPATPRSDRSSPPATPRPSSQHNTKPTSTTQHTDTNQPSLTDTPKPVNVVVPAQSHTPTLRPQPLEPSAPQERPSSAISHTSSTSSTSRTSISNTGTRNYMRPTASSQARERESSPSRKAQTPSPNSARRATGPASH